MELCLLVWHPYHSLSSSRIGFIYTVMFHRLSLLVIRKPRLILVTWFVIWLLALPFASRISEVLSSEVDTAPGSVAASVERDIRQNFATLDGYSVYLLSKAEAQPSPTDAVAYESFLRELEDNPIIGDVTSPSEALTLPLKADNGAAVARIDLNAADFAEARELTYQLSQELPAGHHLTGGAALENELIDISEADVRRAELFGIPLSLIILIFAFGAVVAASLPLLVAMLSVTLSLALLFLIGQSWTLASYAQIIVTMLGLATGIDYALVIINRFREELRRGLDKVEATAITTRSAGRAVVSSGFTVMIALCALLIPRSQFVQSIGVGGIVVLLFSVSTSITLLPALLVLLGKNVNALSLTYLWRRFRLYRHVKKGNVTFSSHQLGKRSQAFWQRWAERVLRYPWAWAVSGVALLLVLSLPALNMNLSVAGIQNLTEDVAARQDYDLLVDMRLDSLLRSYDILIDMGEKGFYHPSSVRKISKVTRAITKLEHTQYVLSPTYAPSLPSIMLHQYYATEELARQSVVAPLVESTVAPAGRYVLIQVFPERIINNGDAQEFQQQLYHLLSEHELQGRIGGAYVRDIEWLENIYTSFPWAILVVYLATFVLLGLLFHSLLIPLKSIIVNTLTVLASFGIITLVIQEGYGGQLLGLSAPLGFIESAIPIFIFASVFGISMDYEVFLMARLFEAHQNGLSDREAVTYAIARTGSVITNAAAIMVVVFMVFLFSHLILIKTLSLGLSVAVLLDATLVRLAIVPATMLLLGRLNWWLPKPVAWLAQRLDLQHD